VFKGDKDIWARFAAAPGAGLDPAASDKAKAEADKLNARLVGWTYQLGDWKRKALAPTLDDLKAPPPEKPAAGVSTPAAPAAAEPAPAAAAPTEPAKP
jgi:hypothetical protein